MCKQWKYHFVCLFIYSDVRLFFFADVCTCTAVRDVSAHIVCVCLLFPMLKDGGRWLRESFAH